MKMLYTLLGFWCFSRSPFCGSPGLEGWQVHSGVYGAVTASCRHVEGSAGTNLTFVCVAASSLLQDPCGVIFCLLRSFYTPNHSSLVCSSVTSKFTVYIVTFMHVWYHFVLCVIAKTSFMRLL